MRIDWEIRKKYIILIDEFNVNLNIVIFIIP